MCKSCCPLFTPVFNVWDPVASLNQQGALYWGDHMNFSGVSMGHLPSVPTSRGDWFPWPNLVSRPFCRKLVVESQVIKFHSQFCFLSTVQFWESHHPPWANPHFMGFWDQQCLPCLLQRDARRWPWTNTCKATFHILTSSTSIVSNTLNRKGGHCPCH